MAGSISRADLAAICVECAFNDAAAKATFEVYDKGSELSTTSLTVSVHLAGGRSLSSKVRTLWSSSQLGVGPAAVVAANVTVPFA